MKQQITAEQLEMLTQDQKEELREWWIKFFKSLYPYDETQEKIDRITFPLLTIGQMIAFLDDHVSDWKIYPFEDYDGVTHKSLYYVHGQSQKFGRRDLCDALWEAVVETFAGSRLQRV